MAAFLVFICVRYVDLAALLWQECYAFKVVGFFFFFFPLVEFKATDEL